MHMSPYDLAWLALMLHGVSTHLRIPRHGLLLCFLRCSFSGSEHCRKPFLHVIWPQGFQLQVRVCWQAGCGSCLGPGPRVCCPTSGSAGGAGCPLHMGPGPRVRRGFIRVFMQRRLPFPHGIMPQGLRVLTSGSTGSAGCPFHMASRPRVCGASHQGQAAQAALSAGRQAPGFCGASHQGPTGSAGCPLRMRIRPHGAMRQRVVSSPQHAKRGSCMATPLSAAPPLPQSVQIIRAGQELWP